MDELDLPHETFKPAEKRQALLEKAKSNLESASKKAKASTGGGALASAYGEDEMSLDGVDASSQPISGGLALVLPRSDAVDFAVKSDEAELDDGRADNGEILSFKMYRRFVSFIPEIDEQNMKITLLSAVNGDMEGTYEVLYQVCDESSGDTTEKHLTFYAEE